MAEHGDRHDLDRRRPRPPSPRRRPPRASASGAGLAEQVEHAPPDGAGRAARAWAEGTGALTGAAPRGCRGWRPAARRGRTRRGSMPARRAASTAERGRCAHRHDGAEARRPRLLHDLEAGPAADVEAEVGGRAARRRGAADRRPCRRRCGGRCPPAPPAARPSRSKAAAACTAPVAANRSWSGCTRAGTSARSSTDQGAPTGSGVDARPHLLDGGRPAHAARRGARAQARRRDGGRAAGVDAHDVELALDRAPGGAVAAGEHRRAGQAARRRGTKPDRQLEVVARRAHGGRHEVAVEVHLQRLLDDQVVGAPSQRGAVPVLGEQLRGAAPGHGPRVATRQSGGVLVGRGWLVRLSRRACPPSRRTRGTPTSGRSTQMIDDLAAASTSTIATPARPIRTAAFGRLRLLGPFDQVTEAERAPSWPS